MYYIITNFLRYNLNVFYTIVLFVFYTIFIVVKIEFSKQLNYLQICLPAEVDCCCQLIIHKCV